VTHVAWLDGLRAKVDEANARHGSMFSRLREDREKLGRHLDRELEKLGKQIAAREAVAVPELHAQVMAAFKTGQLEELTPRQQRYAAKQFRHVTPPQMQSLLQAHPPCWRVFATECFKRWDELADAPERAAFARLLCLAPRSVEFLHQSGRVQDLVEREAPTTIARQVSSADLGEARTELRRRGFDASWSFSAIALAMWARLRVEHDRAFGRTWEAVRRDRELEAMLLPGLVGRNSSWFSEESRPARIKGSVVASSIFVSTLIRAAYTKGVEGVFWSEFTERLLESEFRDPRMPPESHGWVKLRTFDEPAYQAFLGLLISDDLEIFFAHAMTDKRRRDFWLRYLKSIQRTVCILDRSAYQRIDTQLRGGDKKMAAALSRARRFSTKGNATSPQAFCLYFASVVIVEFSEKGNAAYVYDRRVFEAKFEASVYKNALGGPADLKSQDRMKQRILHMSGWESDLPDVLAKLGIVPDVHG
jgi:hypothetical protein